MRSLPPDPPRNSAEAAVWERLMRSGQPWVVIHNHYLPAPLRRGVREIDLLVITPRALVILEVKSRADMRVADGVWTDAEGARLRDPIHQAQTLRGPLRDYLASAHPEWATLPMGALVILPNARLARGALHPHVVTADALDDLPQRVGGFGASSAVPVDAIADHLAPSADLVPFTHPEVASRQREVPVSADIPAIIRERMALLTKQMVHGLDPEELDILTHSSLTPLPLLRVTARTCDDERGLRAAVPVPLRGEGAFRGVLIAESGGHILLRASHSRDFATGVIRTGGVRIPDHEDLDTRNSATAHGFDATVSPSAGVVKTDPQAAALEDPDEVAELTPTEDDERIFGLTWVGLDTDQEIRLRLLGSTWCPITLEASDRPMSALWERAREATTTLIPGTAQRELTLPLALDGSAAASEQESHRLCAKILYRRTPATHGYATFDLAVIFEGQASWHADRLTRTRLEVSMPREAAASFEALTGDDLGPLAHRPTVAVGRNAAATWELHDGQMTLTAGYWPTFREHATGHSPGLAPIPALADLRTLVDEYCTHLQGVDWSALGEQSDDVRRRAMDLATACNAGLALLESDADLYTTFTDAARAVMADTPRLGHAGWELPLRPGRTWRPFQMLFVLATLASTLDHRHPDRSEVAVIEFPTGGGKTEAYLLLAALTLLHARHHEGNPSGARVLMRYPLKLLAAQQLQRAAAVTSRLNIVVKNSAGRYGNRPVRIGLWAGSSLTPNRWDSSHKKNVDLAAGLPLTACALCGDPLKLVSPAGQGPVLRCENANCYFGSNAKADCRIDMVDTDVYQRKPEFLIATLDKLAVTPWRIDTVTEILNDGLQLVIQDELHMVDDELGSLEGLYQILLEQLTAGATPKIVAASATTRHTDRQVERLYGRTRLLRVPAAETRDGEWFVAKPGERLRTTVTGILPNPCAPRRRTLSRLLAAQLQAAQTTLGLALSANEQGHLSDRDLQAVIRAVDPFWTNLVFFGSRPLLRETSLLADQDLDGIADRLRYANNYPGNTRRLYSTKHLLEASSESASSIAEIIAGLQLPMTVQDGGGNSSDAAALCLATSMIEVGVDVDRLGLMTFVGHPKETSSYIQASGRVGRQHPALTYVFYRRDNRRDLSVAESFQAYHERRSEKVEPALLAPFARGAVTRALPALAAVSYWLQGRSFSFDHSRLTVALRDAAWRVTARAPWGGTRPQWLTDELAELERRAVAANANGKSVLVVPGDLRPTGTPSGVLLSLERRENDVGLNWYAATSLRTVAGEVNAAINRAAWVTEPAATSATPPTDAAGINDDEDEA